MVPAEQKAAESFGQPGGNDDEEQPGTQLGGEPDLSDAFSAWDAGNPAGALERLQEALAEVTDPETRDRLRRVMVAIFTELGPDDPLAREHRRRLSAALNCGDAPKKGASPLNRGQPRLAARGSSRALA